MAKKKLYAAGESITIRLRQNDGELADYLNAQLKPTDTIIDGIYMKKNADEKGGVKGANLSTLIPVIENIVNESVKKAIQGVAATEIAPMIESMMKSMAEMISSNQQVSLPKDTGLKEEIREQAAAREQKQIEEEIKTSAKEEDLGEIDPEVAEAMDSIAEWV